MRYYHHRIRIPGPVPLTSAHAFSTAALKNYEPVIAKRGAQFVELLAEKKELNFVHWVHLFT